MEIDFFAPSTVRIHTGAVDAGTGAREGRREGGFAFMGLNTMTPETESTTHYFWSGANKRQPGAPSGCERLRASLEITFAEDKLVVEAQQKSLERQPEPLVMIASDAGMVRARRLVSMRLEVEAG
jgi:vanillate O-demethylase monooxygenase subunit